MKSFVLDGVAGRKRKKSDPPRAEPIIAPRPKYKRIKTYCDADDDSDDELIDVETMEVGLSSLPKQGGLLPCSATPTPLLPSSNDTVTVAVDGTPGLDPDCSAVESIAETWPNSVQPIMSKQSNENGCEPTKEFVNCDPEKIPSTATNQEFIKYIQQIDSKKRKEGLERIFTLCYLAAQGCLQKCKKMMDQLKINSYIKLVMHCEKKFNKIGLPKCKLSLCEDFEEKIELCNKRKYLDEIICNKYMELFGMEFYELDNEILEQTTVLKTHVKLNKNIKTANDCKSLCRLIKVDSLNPSLSPSIEPNVQSSESCFPTASEIENLQKSMAELIKKIQIRNKELKLKKKICGIFSINDKTFSGEIIYKLALHFSNDDFLLKCDELWKSSNSELIGGLLMQLVGTFDNSKNNMAYLTGCLVCVFRVIIKKSSMSSEELRSKFNVFINIIRKHVKIKDHLLWKEWFLPAMFFDWCLFLVNLFMVDKKVADLDELQIFNAKWYFRKIKRSQYVLSNKKTRSTKIGIFEFSKSEDLTDIGLIYINSEQTSENKKGIEEIEEPLVKKPGSKIETKSGKEHEKHEDLLDIDLMNTNLGKESENVKGIEAVKEPFIKKPESEIETKSIKEQGPMKIIEIVDKPQLLKESESREKSDLVKEPSKLCKKTYEATTKLLSAPKTKVLKSACLTKETNSINEVRKYIHVNSEFNDSNTFYNSTTSSLTLLNQIIENIKRLENNAKKKITQNGVVMTQLSTQVIPEQNESVAFFTMPNNPQKYHLTNSVQQTNMPFIQPHPSSTHGLTTVSAQSTSLNTLQHQTIINTNKICNVSSNSYPNSTQVPNAYFSLNRPQVTPSNNFAQNCYYNGYYNTYNSGICQPNNMNCTTSASNIVENQFVPVPSTQCISSNTSNPYKDLSINIEYSRNYTQITPSKNMYKAQVPVLSSLLSNSTVPKATSTNIVSMSPSNNPNNQSPKSVIIQNTSVKNSSTASTYQPPEPSPQTSPDLPNAQSPNMPLQSNSNTRTIMKCTNAICNSHFPITDIYNQSSVNCCLNGHYCSTVCQNFDYYYHRNECYASQKSSNK